jgi:hypothetical protein
VHAVPIDAPSSVASGRLRAGPVRARASQRAAIYMCLATIYTRTHMRTPTRAHAVTEARIIGLRPCRDGLWGRRPTGGVNQGQ